MPQIISEGGILKLIGDMDEALQFTEVVIDYFVQDLSKYMERKEQEMMNRMNAGLHEQPYLKLEFDMLRHIYMQLSS